MRFFFFFADAMIANLFASHKQIIFEFNIKAKRILGDTKRMEE